MGSSSTDADHRARLHRQEVVADLSQQALETEDLDGLLEDAATAIEATLDVEYCAVFERSADGTEAVLRQGAGWRTDRLGSTTVAADRNSLTGTAIRSAEPVVVDVFDGEFRDSLPAPLADRDAVSAVAARIGSVDDPWGVLTVYATEQRGYSDDAVDFLERVADVLGSAIENARTRSRRQLEEERDVFADGPTIVFRWRNEPGWPVEYVSENVADRLGYAPSAFESGDVSYTDLLLEEEVDRIASEVEANSDETTERFSHDPYRVRTADGDVRWVKDTTKIVRDDDGEITHYLGYLVDITERKERERELRRYETIVEAVNDGVYVVDEDGRFTMVNDAYAELVGYDRAELLGEHVSLVVDEETRERARRIEAQLQAGTAEAPSIEAELKTADGDRRPAVATFAMLPGGDGSGRRVGVVRDVSDRKERQQELRRTERRFEAIFEDPNILVGLLDPDGTVRDINGTAMEYVDADLADVTGEPFWETPWWGEGDDVRDDVREWTEQAAAGEYVNFEADLTRPDGERYTLEGVFRPVTDDDGEVTSVIVSDRDVTEREERERQLSTLMDNVPGMVYRCENERGWPMSFVSDACEELTGYDPAALESGDLSWGGDVMVQDDRETLWETVQQGLEENQTFSETYRIETADGERRWVRDYGRGVFDDEGNLVDIEGIIADITERKRLESELAASEQRYRTLVEQFPNGAVALVDEELCYRTVGGSPMDVADATAAEIEGRPVREAVPPSLADELVPRYEAALEGEASSFETESNGRVYDFQIAPVRDDDGDVFAALGMSQDVTERYEYERQLEETTSQLEAATEAGAIGTWEWHIQEDRMVTGTTFADTFGVDPEAAREGVSLDQFIDAIHEADRERVEREIEAAVETCGEYEAEYRVHNADGEIRWVVARGRVECDADGDPVRFPGALTDITERKRAQLQLERTNEQLETLFEILPVGVIVADADGRLLQANDTAEEIWGGDVFDTDSVEEYERYSVWCADTGERIAPEEMTLARVIEGEEVTDPDIYEIETADGERRIIRAEGMPIRNERGEVSRAVATITDITERREYQRQLEESEQRYRTLVDNFPNGAVALFDEDLQYQIVGGTAFEDLEDSSETIVGKTVRERYPPELADQMEAKFEAALGGETSSFEMEFHDREWMAYTVPVMDDGDEIFGGMMMVQDITERKERERELRERERSLERYKEYVDEILDAIDDLFYVIDEDGTLQRWNRSLSEVTGYTDAELAEMDPPDFFEDDRDAVIEAVREGLETGSVNVELDLATKDGDAIPFEFVASTLEDPWGNTVLAGIGRDVTERVERQQRLEESERRYRTLTQHFPNGAVGVYDSDLEYTLAAGSELGGTLPPGDRLEGNRVHDIFPENTVADLEPLFRAALEDGETGSTETTFGGRHWRVWATPLRDADGEIFAGLSFAQDVTEQVEREKHLERYETIVETVNDGVYVVDEDGSFTMVNETYAEMVGYDPADLVGEHVSIVVDDDVSEQVPGLMTEQDDRPTLEADVRTADGEVVPAEATFAMLPEDDSEWHRVGVVRDISERKERERQLEESERRYRTLVENFPDGAVGLYDEDLEYIVVGGEAFDDLGISEDEVAGATLDERFSDDLLEEIEPYFRAVFDGESNTFEYQAHGRDVWAHTLPVRNEDDEIFAGMVMVQDVTERREYERKLEESNERLERFAYAASHDLQEPLRMVTSYLTLLENRYGDAFDEDGREFLEFAVDGADRMREMIDGLLEYSRVETRGDPFEPMDLDDVVDDVLADLQFRIEETDAEITVGELPRVEGDPSQLRQVFQNLLSNALTYSGDDPPRVHVDAERRGQEWMISVADEGIGIDPDDQERVFTIFDRLHSRENYDGTGIGLALCERIVERHGGEIWVDSEPGEGSTFSFTVPAASDQ